MEIQGKDGQSFYVPVKMTDKEVMSINSFKKWEKAFRVYVAITSKSNVI